MITEKKYNEDAMGNNALTTSLGAGVQNSTGGGGGDNSARPTSSGRFTNLQSYIAKNRGATNQTLDKARNDAGFLRDRYDTGVKELNNIADQGRSQYSSVRENQNYLNNLAQDPYAILNENNLPGSKDNPTEQRQAQRFRGATAGSIASNEPLADYSTARQNLSGLSQDQSRIKNLNTSGGIRDYLNSIRGNRPGSAGGMNLDEFLLTSTPEARSTTSQLSQQAANLDLNAQPGLDTLQSEYSNLSSFDPAAIQSQIQTRLQGNLDVTDEASVNRYNQAQQIYGGDLATYQNMSSKTPVQEEDVYRGGIKDFVPIQDWQTQGYIAPVPTVDMSANTGFGSQSAPQPTQTSSGITPFWESYGSGQFALNPDSGAKNMEGVDPEILKLIYGGA